jgi:hypothetical protein
MVDAEYQQGLEDGTRRTLAELQPRIDELEKANIDLRELVNRYKQLELKRTRNPRIGYNLWVR